MGGTQSKKGNKRYVSKINGKGCFTDDYFTQEQKTIVINTWQYIDKDAAKLGTKIFLRIFEKKPETKDLFPFRDLNGEELLNNSVFRCHAMRFFQAVGNTINNIDSLDITCAPTLVNLGKKHVEIVDFMEAYIDTFLEAIQFVFESELGQGLCTPEVRKAWAAVFHFIVTKMMEGYHSAQHKSITANSATNGSIGQSETTQNQDIRE